VIYNIQTKSWISEETAVIDFHFHAIGVIHTPFQETEGVPIQSARSDAAGTVEVFPQYLEGLDGVEEFSHLILVYAFHRAPDQVQLLVKPFLDDRLHGIFATRFPNRPNQIGLSVVRFVSRVENALAFLGADMLDGTPLLDIKPYVPDFDIHTATKIGWYAHRAHP
jgi:tRNA-Thr(GGU) m(6)t(6)A37 methyltransferase TsaA